MDNWICRRIEVNKKLYEATQASIVRDFGVFRELYSIYVKLDENKYWSIKASTDFLGKMLHYFDNGLHDFPKLKKGINKIDLKVDDLQKLIEHKDNPFEFGYLCDRIFGFYSWD